MPSAKTPDRDYDQFAPDLGRRGAIKHGRQSTVAGLYLLLRNPTFQEGAFAALLLGTRINVAFGAGSVVVFLAVLSLYCVMRFDQLLQMLRKTAVLWLFPLIAVLSTLWAQYPSVTLRAAIQMSLTALAGLMLSQSRHPRAVLVGLFIVYFGYAFASLMSGRTEAVGLRDMALVGLGGEAKNFFSESAGVALLLSIAIAGMGLEIKRLWAISLGVLCAAISLYIIYRANSAGAVLSFGFSGAMLITLLFFRAAAPSAKLVMLCFIGLAAVIGAAFYAVAQSAILEFFGKDPGLTGRGFIWYQADFAMAERPMLGLGYFGFWHPENPHAVGIWRHFKLLSEGTGFSFHNAYIQTIVEVGYVGLALLLIGWIAGGFALLRRFVLTASLPTCLWICYFLSQMLKSGVEPVRPGTLIAPTILLFVALGFGFAPIASTDSSDAAQGTSRHRFGNWAGRRGRIRPAPGI